MKIIAENLAEQRLLNRIKAMSNEIATQDNRITQMPMWTIKDGGRGSYDDYGAVMFFTGKAAEEHLVTDAHHYENPHTYVRSAHNNPELLDVVHLLLLAGKNDINSNHYGRLR